MITEGINQEEIDLRNALEDLWKYISVGDMEFIKEETILIAHLNHEKLQVDKQSRPPIKANR